MKIYSLLLLLFLTTGAFAQESVAARQKQLNLPKSNLAIQAYDPVAYFTDGKAVKGTAAFKYEYKGVFYYFSSSEHRELFKANPTKYEPQYGGWCAYAMGEKDERVSIDPKTFKIKDGKLYLFYNKNGDNTKVYWNENEQELLKNANYNWRKSIQ